MRQTTLAGKLSPGVFATALLVVMAIIMVVSGLPFWHRLYGPLVWLDVLKAGARAGVVGGLADWFAVTALFRQPMGLPIPHTAILQRRKDQIGEALGRFVVTHFFNDADITALLARFDVAHVVVQTLEAPENSEAVWRMLRGVVPGALERLGDGRGAAALIRIVPVLLQGEEAAVLLTRGMRAMVKGDVHQEVFSFFLRQMKDLVMTHEAELQQFVEARVREQGGRVLGWTIGGTVARQVLGALKMELERVDPMDSALRQGFTDWVRERIDQFEHDPERIKAFTDGIAAFFSHESLREWGASLWRRLCAMAERDSQREDGWSAQTSEALLHYMLELLERQDIWSERINQVMCQTALRFMPHIRQEIAGLIARVLEGWDGVQLSRRLEDGVGRDLAYIRVNGTLVGFLIGAILEGMSVFLT